MTPVFRLPQLPAHLRWQLNRVAGLAQSNSPNRLARLNRVVHAFKKELRTYVPSEIIDRVSAMQGTLKLVTDWPLEWLDIGDVPLGLRFDTSRIPATPGTMLFQGLTAVDEKIISLRAFEKILVIRSFSRDDPLRRVLERAISVMPVPENPWSHTFFEDVETEDQLVAALNRYDGVLVVFDCHGYYSPEDQVGSLIIGGKRVDPWALRGRARMPLIAVLSACDTHSVNGTHASVANGLLTMGAICVLGTLLPIQQSSPPHSSLDCFTGSMTSFLCIQLTATDRLGGAM